MVPLGYKWPLSGSSEKHFLPCIATADSFQRQCDPPEEKEEMGMSYRLTLTYEDIISKLYSASQNLQRSLKGKNDA